MEPRTGPSSEGAYWSLGPPPTPTHQAESLSWFSSRVVSLRVLWDLCGLRGPGTSEVYRCPGSSPTLPLLSVCPPLILSPEPGPSPQPHLWLGSNTWFFLVASHPSLPLRQSATLLLPVFTRASPTGAAHPLPPPLFCHKHTRTSPLDLGGVVLWHLSRTYHTLWPLSIL